MYFTMTRDENSNPSASYSMNSSANSQEKWRAVLYPMLLQESGPRENQQLRSKTGAFTETLGYGSTALLACGIT